MLGLSAEYLYTGVLGHDFYSPEYGWIDAEKLQTGDVLVLPSGDYVFVEDAYTEELDLPVTIYNFEVEDFHTYFVGESHVLVHNKNCTNPGGRHGGSSHRAKVDEVRMHYENMRYDVSIREQRVSIPGTNRYRYPDLTVELNGNVEYIQVGRVTGTGWPVAREMRAIYDLIKTHNHVTFFSYM